MNVIGIDFTSAPSRRKPIVCCRGTVEGDTLAIENIDHWPTFDSFEKLLNDHGEWLAAMDFPFGQPRKLIEHLGWPQDWNQYVARVGSQTKSEFVDLINRYREGQPVGQKHHLRDADVAASACSPMMLYGVPVGKMFFEGAPRLQSSDVSVLPSRPTDSNKIAIEGYPALVARELVGNQRYKGDATDALRKTRQRMVQRIVQEPLTAYSLKVELPSDLSTTILENHLGDELDALLCTIQAASAELKKSKGYGIPSDIDELEGWIVDPTITHDQP